MHEWATEKKFLERVKNHTMEVIRDDGLYRHVRFSNNGSSIDRFDLVTWPWHLCYTGDMGTYVFCRTEDMFQFFRTRPKDDGSIYINEGYWAEKLEAVDRASGVRKFDEARFREAVRDHWKDMVSHAIRAGHMDKAGSARLWEAMEHDVLSCLEDGEIRARDAADSFECEIQGHTYRLEDFWDHDFETFTGRFIWACYAIAWGIKQYEEAKAKP